MVRPAPHLDRPTRRAGRGRVGRGLARPDGTPYGVAMHGFAADVNGDGVVTVSDLGVVSANHNSGDELKPGDTGYDPDAFLDGGDEIDVSVFLTRYSPYVSGGSNPTFNAGWIDNPGDPNGPDNSVGYDGYWFDLAGATEATSTGLYMVRHRVYDPKLGRWLQRDPLGYVDGMNLYSYGAADPASLSDPQGLTPSQPGNSNKPGNMLLSRIGPAVLIRPIVKTIIFTTNRINEKQQRDAVTTVSESGAVSCPPHQRRCLQSEYIESSYSVITMTSPAGNLGGNSKFKSWHSRNILRVYMCCCGACVLRVGDSERTEHRPEGSGTVWQDFYWMYGNPVTITWYNVTEITRVWGFCAEWSAQAGAS